MKKIAVILAILFLVSCYDIALAPAQNGTLHIVLGWPWDSTIVYNAGDCVTMPPFTQTGPEYQSLQNDNLGHEPPDPSWWTQIR